ncbi:MAG TPA: multicopper oxidase domain-containing protein, partial [Candidatus Limnocylindria bacterium]|nr:multicopper oxidase domain-containing protein [Candidatus Limnocylindria bacterium]
MTDPGDDPPGEEATADSKATFARRTLIGAVGFATLGGIAAGALGLTGRGAAPARVAAATSTPILSPTPRRTPAPTATMDHDAHAESVVKAFPAKTAGAGLQPLASRVVDGAREFELTCEKIRWEVTPGVVVDALSYNGQVPGPIIRVVEDERVRVRVTNKTDQTTGVHWHGQRIVNKMDGVPFITQPVIKPGETFIYDFVARPFGSHMYHSHHNATEQVGRGMLGPLLVMPKSANVDPAYDKDELFIFNDQLGGLTINGKGFPATSPFTARLGQRIRFRFMNEG